MLQKMLGFDPSQLHGFVSELVANAQRVAVEQQKIREYLDLLAKHQLKMAADLQKIMGELGITSGIVENGTTVCRFNHDGGECGPARDTEAPGLEGTGSDAAGIAG